MGNIACRRLSPDEVCATFNHLNGRMCLRDRALFALGVTTGFRISELLSLRFSSVIDGDGVKPIVTVPRSFMKQHRKGRTMDIVPLAGRALLIWCEYAFNHYGIVLTDYLFCKPDGSAITRLHAWSVIKRAYRFAGVRGNVATHSMRMTFVSDSRIYAIEHPEVGDPLMFAQRMAGHSNINSTSKYLETASRASMSAASIAISKSYEKGLHNDV